MKTQCSDSSVEQRPQSSIKELDLIVEGVAPDYATALELARKEAGDGMLLAWYDAKKDVGYPQVEECAGSQPGWYVYAKNRGANLIVNINSGDFIFIFMTGVETQGG